MDIHARLHQLLMERGWTEYRLSRECDLAQTTIGNIFRRNTMPSLATLETICKGFGISMSQLFAEEEMVEPDAFSGGARSHRRDFLPRETGHGQERCFG